MRLITWILGFFLFAALIVHGQTFTPNELTPGPQAQYGPVAGAIFSLPAVGDFDGDGILDLILATYHHGKGTRFYKGFRNEEGRPLCKPGVDIALPARPMTGVDWNGDDLTDILQWDKGGLLYLCKGTNPPSFLKAVSLPSSEPVIKAEALTAYPIGEFVDVILGEFFSRDHWTKGDNHRTSTISLWQGYDKSGKWRGLEGLGFLTGFRFPRRENAPVSGRVLAGVRAPLAGHLAACPIAVDADCDGDQDLLFADFVGNFFYAENRGTNLKSAYEDPITLFDTKGERLCAAQCMVRGQAADWDGDDKEDLIFGTEDGFVYVCTNQWNGNGPPVFNEPAPILQESPPLDCGVCSVPSACDLDADGDTDFVLGNASGELLILWNRGSDAKPEFDLPIRIDINGKIFRLIAGYNGSVQGPGEASWGYIDPCAVDVDRDGDIDIVYSSVNGYHTCLLNQGAPEKPKWSNPIDFRANGKRLRTVWRTRPIMTDWNGDGALDYICLNQKGEIGVYPGSNDRPWRELDGWTSWKRANGKPINPGGEQGMEGRAKLDIADWDGDGQNDLLISLKGGTSWSEQYGRTNLSYIVFLKCVQGGNDAVFEEPKPIRLANGDDIELGDHNATPEVVSLFGDQKPGLLLGCENGRLYYYSRNELSW